MVNESTNVTSYDVARVAQVSVGTVIRVLNNKPNVDEALRAKVLEVVEELGYVYVPKKRGGVSSQEGDEQARTEPALKNILAYFPRQPVEALTPVSAFTEAYYYRVLRGVESECVLSNVHLIYNLLAEQPNAFEQITAALERSRADGVLLVNCGSPALLNELAQAQIPLVAVEPEFLPKQHVDIVMNDDFEGGRLATQHLIDLGHRDIALLSHVPLNYIAERRRAGYRCALLDANLTPGPTFFHPEEIVQGIQDTSVFSALFCYNDMAALETMQVLREQGLRIPEDISIVSFDDLDAAAISSPPLTAIHAHTETKGRVAIRRLLDRIANPQAPISWSVVPVSLTVRASTRLVEA